MIINSTNIKVNLLKIKNKARENYIYQMEKFIKASFKMTYSMEKEIINGQMVRLIRENGQTIKCMVQELLHGQMESFTVVSIFKIKNKGKVYFLGKMEWNMRGNGQIDYNMEQGI